MNHLSTKSFTAHDTLETKKTSSPWTMLFTMLLLIAGFCMASAMLAYQIIEQKKQDAEPNLSLSALTEKGKSLWSRLPALPDTKKEGTVLEKEPTPIDSLKNIVAGSGGDNVRWPRLKLTGYGKSIRGTEDFAIINGDKVHPGEYVGKVKLVEVRDHDVVVEYMGERKLLTVVLQD